MIELKKVNKSYGEKQVLTDICLKVSKGSWTIITGESGKGKTTLLNIMGLLEKPDKGDVIIMGNTNPKFNSKKGRALLHHNIAYLFQNFGLVENKTVYQNLILGVAFSKEENKRGCVKEVLEQLNMEETLNKKIFQLSGGEQQRIALAKVIIKDPDIILADEPTGSLDDGNKAMVLEVLSQLNRLGKTVVIVTHDSSLEKYSDQIIRL